MEGVDPRLTDAGRRVFGGDGVAPDTCIEPGKTGTVVAALQSKQAFVNFARHFESADVVAQTAVLGAGSRANVGNDKVRLIRKEFKVTPQVVDEFAEFVKSEKMTFDQKEFDAAREEISAEIMEETMRQVFGEGAARLRLFALDPQLKKGIDSIPNARLLLKDPQRYISETATKRAAAR